MKRLITKLSLVALLAIFSSCSKDDIIQNNDLIGVWERTDVEDNRDQVMKLVFASDFTGLSINRVSDNSGEIISSVSNFNWNIKDKNITVSTEDVSEMTYTINSEGHLVLSSFQDAPFVKVSNDIQDY